MSDTSENRTTWSLIGSVGAALAAASCCTLPLLLVSLGLGGAWLSSLQVLVPYRPFFITASLGLFGLAFYWGYRRLTAPGCTRQAKRRTKVMLAVAGLVVLGFLFSNVIISYWM